MPSALTGNTSGLATAVSPGIVGTGTQTFGGAKTFQDGAIIKSRLGSTIAAGNLGYTINSRSTISLATTTYTAGVGITLYPGIWLITGSSVIDLLTSQVLGDYLAFVSPNNTSNDTTWRESFYNDNWISGVTISKCPLTLNPQYIRYDGTNLYRYQDGSWIQPTASGTGSIWLKVYKAVTGTHTTYTQLTACLVG